MNIKDVSELFISKSAHIEQETNPNTSWQIIKGNIRDETVIYRKKRAEATPIQQLKINTVIIPPPIIIDRNKKSHKEHHRKFG